MNLLILLLIFPYGAHGEPHLAFATHKPAERRPAFRPLRNHQETQSEENADLQRRLRADLVGALDLKALVQRVSDHAGTRRGREAILALIQDNQQATEFSAERTFSRRDRAILASQSQQGAPKLPDFKKSTVRLPFANSAKEARDEYELVEESISALVDDTNNLTFPPFYSGDSSPLDTSTIVYTDDDEWLGMPADTWTLENIMQAEQVIRMMMGVKQWACREEVQTWVPGLSSIGRRIDKDENLPILFSEISGLVEIVRVRTLADPGAKSSFSFRFKEDKFPVLKLLRDREKRLLQKGGKTANQEVIAIVEEIEDVESQIRIGLAQSILGRSSILNQGMDAIARLDTLFARAAFGLSLNGEVPIVSDKGVISVAGFVHPVLATNDGFSVNAGNGEIGEVVPVDLELSSDEGMRALIISGPNGGGKTLSMKSFGVVSIMARLGIPIPVSGKGNQRPRVDHFGDILVDLGDQQNVLAGESTWTAKLNSWSSIISKLRGDTRDTTDQLVLLDELGSGTDPEAGGAVAQAVLEEMTASPRCHIVATTHSPRLKSFSYQSPLFNCASVLLDGAGDSSEGYGRPNFRLSYGLIGESNAMVATSRCSPALPESVLSRACELMADASEEGDIGSKTGYIRALTSSMEEQVRRANEEREAAERHAEESVQCRNAMLILAAAYENHLGRLEHRLEDCHTRLKQQTDDDLELVGETLAELRIAKRQIQSQQELLREKGLKLMPSSYELQPGESVVVLAKGGWEGATVPVVATSGSDDRLGPTEVLVKPSASMLSWDNMYNEDANIGVVDMMMDRPIIFQRHELAIWDSDSVWDYEDIDAPPVTTTSVSDSVRRLESVLSGLKTKSASTSAPKSFTSSRQRKASKKKARKKKK